MVPEVSHARRLANLSEVSPPASASGDPGAERFEALLPEAAELVEPAVDRLMRCRLERVQSP